VSADGVPAVGAGKVFLRCVVRRLRVGQQLARVELQVVYGTLYKRIPTLALATGIDQIEFKHDHFAYGVFELPVSW